MHLGKRPFAKVFEHPFAIFSALPDLAVLKRFFCRLIHHPLAVSVSPFSTAVMQRRSVSASRNKNLTFSSGCAIPVSEAT